MVVSGASRLRIVLASASPRRKIILQEMGLTFDVVVPEVNEVHWDDDPTGTVATNARRKCQAVAALQQEALVIAADTVVVLDGRCLGKPDSMADAEKMLLSFSGRTQIVYSGVAMQAPNHEPFFHLERSEVDFKEMDHDHVKDYFSLVYPLDRAGAYDINEHAELIIKAYRGSRTNIMGLPREVVAGWLEEVACS
jgi:septum formation protein